MDCSLMVKSYNAVTVIVIVHVSYGICVIFLGKQSHSKLITWGCNNVIIIIYMFKMARGESV